MATNDITTRMVNGAWNLAPDAGRLEWRWHDFSDLSAHDLYALLALRQEVFILEQRCLYPDIDGSDQAAQHLLGWHNGDGAARLVAYLRCFEPGVKYAEAALGRIVTAPAVRGQGLGSALVQQGIAQVQGRFPAQAIRISAQAHLEDFYRRFGFESSSAPYDEDGILHIDMLRAAF
ncbi:MAG: GNAT family N-acetyltransferase [Pseudomonadota bacterium]